jgi:hypothetical protein
MDPGTKDITKVILPTSPNSPIIKGSGSSKVAEKVTEKGNNSSWADDSEMESESGEGAETESVTDSSIPAGAERRKLKVLESYPPPPSDALVFSGRSSLTPRTPPRPNENAGGSLGS